MDNVFIKKLVMKDEYPQVSYSRDRVEQREDCQFPAKGYEDTEARSAFYARLEELTEVVIPILGLDPDSFWGGDKTKISQVNFKYTEESVGVTVWLSSFDAERALAHKAGGTYLTTAIVEATPGLSRIIEELLKEIGLFLIGATDQLSLLPNGGLEPVSVMLNKMKASPQSINGDEPATAAAVGEPSNV